MNKTVISHEKMQIYNSYEILSIFGTNEENEMTIATITNDLIEIWGTRLERDYQEDVAIAVIAVTDWNCECDRLAKREYKVIEISSDGTNYENIERIKTTFHKMQQILNERIPLESQREFNLILESLQAQVEEISAIVARCETLKKMSRALNQGMPFHIEFDRVMKVPKRMIFSVLEQE